MIKCPQTFCRFWSAKGLPFALFALAGCRRGTPPGTADTPALPLAPKGVFQDVCPTWSPDGKAIVFLRATPDRKHQLFWADADRKHFRPLLPPEIVSPDRPYAPSHARYVAPERLAFTPDGKLLAFTRVDWITLERGERFPGTSLWSYDFTTKKTKPLALHPPRYKGDYLYFRSPQWSPDGKRIAFVGEGKNGQTAVFVRLLATQSLNALSPLPDTYKESDWVCWEPQKPTAQGSRLTYRQVVRRSTAAPHLEQVRRVRFGTQNVSETGAFWNAPFKGFVAPAQPRIGHIVWSPRGEWFACTLTPDALNFSRYEVWVVRRDGKEARRVSPKDGRGYLAPVWLSEEQIGMVSPSEAGMYRVQSIRRDGRELKIYGEIESADCDWSPDRKTLLYAPPYRKASAVPSTTLKMLRVEFTFRQKGNTF